MKRSLEELKKYPRMGLNTPMKPTNSIEGLVDLINFVGGVQNKTICEIGCFIGISTETFLNFNPKKLYAIDIWGLNSNYKDCDWIKKYGSLNFNLIESQFREMCKNYDNVEIIKDYSKHASFGFENESLDLVYIDGEHTYDSVLSDITHWLPKVKKNGYISGHDFNFESVKMAIIDSFKNTKLEDQHVRSFSDNSWAIKVSTDF